jgi:hypothetical protein
VDTSNGFITNIPEEIEDIPEKSREALTKDEYEALLKYVENKRVEALHQMRAKQKVEKTKAFTDKKRARKIADKSRRRNRK